MVVHWPQFLPCLFWLWTFTRLESPFLAGNVFSQVGQQCQTDLKEVVLSYISFEVIFFALKVACFKWSEAIRDDLLALSKWQPPHCSPCGCSDFNFTFISSADLWGVVYWSYLCHRFSLEKHFDIADFWIVEQSTSATPLPLSSSCLT